MKGLALLIAGLLLCSICALAGEYPISDIGKTAERLHGVSSELVRTAESGDTLIPFEAEAGPEDSRILDVAVESKRGLWLNQHLSTLMQELECTINAARQRTRMAACKKEQRQ